MLIRFKRRALLAFSEELEDTNVVPLGPGATAHARRITGEAFVRSDQRRRKILCGRDGFRSYLPLGGMSPTITNPTPPPQNLTVAQLDTVRHSF